MTKNFSHIACIHPATKAGRAACRKERAAQTIALRADIQAVIDSYYDNSGEIEEIAAKIDRLSQGAGSESLTAAARGYYDGTLEIEDIICMAQQGIWEV